MESHNMNHTRRQCICLFQFVVLRTFLQVFTDDKQHALFLWIELNSDADTKAVLKVCTNHLQKVILHTFASDLESTGKTKPDKQGRF